MKKNPPERGRWRRILAIGMCGCVSVCMYANVLKSQGGHSLKEATLKTAFEQVLVFQEEKHICFEKAKKEAMQPSMTSFFVISMNDYLHISRMI